MMGKRPSMIGLEWRATQEPKDSLVQVRAIPGKVRQGWSGGKWIIRLPRKLSLWCMGKHLCEHCRIAPKDSRQNDFSFFLLKLSVPGFVLYCFCVL